MSIIAGRFSDPGGIVFESFATLESSQSWLALRALDLHQPTPSRHTQASTSTLIPIHIATGLDLDGHGAYWRNFWVT